MSTITHDDPRLTAYALGELPAKERALIEQLIARHPELQAEVDQIRALSGDLTRELATDLAQTPALTLPQRNAIAGATQPNRWRVVIGWSVFTTAAAATIAFMILPTIGLVRERAPQRIAMTTPVVTSLDQPRTQEEKKDLVAVTNRPVEIKVATQADLAAPINQLEFPLEEKLISADEEQEEVVLAKGRELAVSTSESGSTGAFMAIGQGGGSRGVYAAKSEDRTDADLPRGREEAVASSEPPARVYVQPPTAPSAPATAARQSASAADAAVDAKGRRPAAPAVGGFRLSGTPAESPTTPPVTEGGETYNQRADHGFRSSRTDPLSTFGLDVDTASYGNVRRMIESGRLPPRDAVRVEELVNYFDYDIPRPQGDEAFGVTVEITACPWQHAHQLARIAVRGKAIATEQRPPLNLVFLVDVSGSMKPDNRLPLIKTGLSLLATNLRGNDRVAIVTYAGSASFALGGATGNQQREILKAIDGLAADGGTNGGSGIQMAYQAAQAGFVQGGVNRVILCTDGDFNVGVTDRGELVRMVQERAKQGVFLTVLGVGQDNLKDATMELLADKANGNYHYLDTIAEARKVLVEQLSGTLVTIAKDVKTQVEFNPTRIAAWRQLGYEKRALAARDFNDDRKDGGEIGADHMVTMLYELVPATVAATAATTAEGLRYQVEPPPTATVLPAHANELMTVKLRYKEPTGDTSRLIQGIVTDAQVRGTPSDDQMFASAVAAFALRLRGTEGMTLDWRSIRTLATGSLRPDREGYRREFIGLIDRVMALDDGSSSRE
jgi:Ca-activated chloride channel homolog